MTPRALTVWYDVEEALEEIIQDYEKVNHIISLHQDDRNRLKGLRMIKHSEGVALELGSGPGNYSRMIKTVHNGPLICLDFSEKMLKVSMNKNRSNMFHYVRGIFEALPFREETFSLVTAAFAIRDSLNKSKAIRETAYVIRKSGRLLLIDIGKSDNPIIQGFMSIFMRFIVPIIGGLTAGYGYRNPWSMLYKTYKFLPSNKRLRSMISLHLNDVVMHESLMGGIIIAFAHKIE